MPGALLLQQFGDLLSDAFGVCAYQVGSSIMSGGWRDVDVRVMLTADQYSAMGLGDPDKPHENAKWSAYAIVFSAYGKQLTGLPIDFQLQEIDNANRQFSGPRDPLMLCEIRRKYTDKR